MTDSRPSVQEILRRRQEAGFSGRDAQLALFRENLLIPVEDERHRFLFSVHGDGGIGKTFLLDRWRQLARDAGRLCAVADDGVYDVPGAMKAIAGQLERDGARLRQFGQRYEEFSKRQRGPGDQKGLADGPAAAITRATVRAGMGAAKGTMIGGAITGMLDPAATADAVELVREAAVDRLRGHDAEPAAGDLTQAFLAGLRELGKPVTLFFDTYERTSPFLDSWLRDVFGGKHGDLPGDIIVAVAGRHGLDTATWSPFLGIMADLPLRPFTAVEVRQVLAHKGVTDEQVIGVIMEVSGGLPLAVAMLAESHPAHPAEVGDVTSGIVGRFLQWEPDPVRRDFVLDAALPHRVNLDVLRVIADAAGVDDAAGLFRWLEGQPFITRHAGGCQFHDIVRTWMNRLYRGRSQDQWRQLHASLAEAFQRWRDQHGEGTKDSWPEDEGWQDCEVERIYHRLCADLPLGLGEALASGISACRSGITAARKWTDMLASVGRDCDSARIGSLSLRLLATLSARDDGDLVAFVDELMRHPAFPAAARCNGYRERGRQCRLAERFDDALAAYGRALEIDPDYGDALWGRGETYRLMRQYEEALADFNRTVELDGADADNYCARGKVLAAIKRYEEAIADFARAIEIGDEGDWALWHRGYTCWLMGRHEEAIADLTRLIIIRPDRSFAIGFRGLSLREIGRWDEALADFGRAVEAEPSKGTWLVFRGDAYRGMGRHEEAIADYSHAIEIDPGDGWAFSGRGVAYRDLRRYEEALADLSHAIELDPRSASYLAARGKAHQLAGNLEQAIEDLDRAIELDPGYAWAYSVRGGVYLTVDWYGEAISDYSNTITFNPENSAALGLRGRLRRLTGKLDEALTDLTQALEIDPGSEWLLYGRGETYRLMGRCGEAIADFTQAIEIDPDYAWAIAARGEARWAMGLEVDALADFTRAIEIAQGDWVITRRGRMHRRAGRIEDGVADFRRAREIDREYMSGAIELAMLGITMDDAPMNYQCIADTEVRAESAGRESRSLVDWLHAERVIVAEGDLPASGARYRPGSSWHPAVASPDHAGDASGFGDVRLDIGRTIVAGMRPEGMRCPSCGTLVALRDGDMPTRAWDLLVDAAESWESGGTGLLCCPDCATPSPVTQWQVSPPWAFGCLTLTFWNWPPLSSEFIGRVSQQLGHRVTLVAGTV